MIRALLVQESLVFALASPAGRPCSRCHCRAALAGLVPEEYSDLCHAAHVPVEAKLQRAVFVFEQFVDDGSLVGTHRLEEGDLALMLDCDDFS